MNLEEALKLYDKAVLFGMIGEWPKALIVVVEALGRANKRICNIQEEAEDRRGDTATSRTPEYNWEDPKWET